MKTPVSLFFAWLSAFSAAISGERLQVVVEHDLSIARPSETIVVPWHEVNRALPGALLQKLSVKDPAGRLLPYQVTNVAPLAKDPKGEGLAYGELIFQYDFAAGETRACFVVERTEGLAPVFPAKVFARYVPERLDDFAWENDRIAHRAYGPALAAPSPEGTKKEVLVTSGIDVWCKRVDYPVVDRWYNKGHDHYHVDEGEGMDMYQVGKSLGCGGTGVFKDGQLYPGSNYKQWRILANGPVRAVFELTYDTWDAGGLKISEVKRYTVDAGQQLDRVDSTYYFDAPGPVTIAMGLNKNCADKNQEPTTTVIHDPATGVLGQWIVQKSNGALGTGIVLPQGRLTGVVDQTGQDVANLLALREVRAGETVTSHVGAAWSRAGRITTKEAWEAYLRAFSARMTSPLKITCRPTK